MGEGWDEGENLYSSWHGMSLHESGAIHCAPTILFSLEEAWLINFTNSNTVFSFILKKVIFMNYFGANNYYLFENIIILKKEGIDLWKLLSNHYQKN